MQTMKTVEIRVPDIGDSENVEVIEVMVKEGDEIAKDQSIVLVESDKASMEIPSPESGKVRELKIKLGDKVSEGTLLLTLSKIYRFLLSNNRRLAVNKTTIRQKLFLLLLEEMAQKTSLNAIRWFSEPVREAIRQRSGLPIWARKSSLSNVIPFWAVFA